jgi:hypothetical protein
MFLKEKCCINERRLVPGGAGHYPDSQWFGGPAPGRDGMHWVECGVIVASSLPQNNRVARTPHFQPHYPGSSGPDRIMSVDDLILAFYGIGTILPVIIVCATFAERRLPLENGMPGSR